MILGIMIPLTPDDDNDDNADDDGQIKYEQCCRV